MQAIKFPVPNRSEYIPSPMNRMLTVCLISAITKALSLAAGPTSWNAGRWTSW